LGAGWVFMKRNDLPHLRPLLSAVPPAHESAAPRAHSSKPPEHAPSASAREEPSASPSASAPVKPVQTAHAAQDDTPPPVVPTTKAVPTSTETVAPPSAVAPDAGWVKPAWAIPDDEPRRVHSDDAHDVGK